MKTQYKYLFIKNVSIFLLFSIIMACGSDSNSLNEIDDEFSEGEYVFAVAAINTQGIKSGLSNLLIKDMSNTNTVSLSWRHPTQNIDGSDIGNSISGYIIYYRRRNSNNFKTVEVYDPTLTNYTLTKL